MSKKDKSKNSKNKSALTATTADRHDLYERSVQTPEIEVPFVSKTFKNLRKRHALSLREDFCGTAAFACEWVKSKDGRTAIGLDIDDEVIAWGANRHVDPTNQKAERVKILKQDVRSEVTIKSDLAVAFNFSYWIFKDRPTLLEYFRSVRNSLVKDGAFFLDIYGGPEAQIPQEEQRKVSGGFTYVWDQDEFNPIDHSIVNYIHFRFKDGSKLEKAFTYKWRLWTLPELKDILAEAGFTSTIIYWEGEDKNGEGNGVYKAKKIAPNDPGWVSYIVALV